MADHLTPDIPTRAHDGRVAWSVVALVAATVLIGTLAPGPIRHGIAAAPSEDVACAEWGDGCQVCQRSETGVACSLPGIACIRTEQTCLRRVGG